MSKPTFFIVGQPKSGTTAFYEFLSPHPQIFVPENKEIHYFCTDFHEENARFHGRLLHFPINTEARYLSLFEKAPAGSVVGEASVHYLYSKVAARNIAAFEPNAKILIFLRNPVDFLYSWHSHSLLTNGEILEQFEDALDAEPARRRGEQLTSLVKVPSYLYYSERVKYAEHIARFMKEFPRDQIKIVAFEDFATLGIEKVYRDILSFLEVDPGFVPDFKVINPRKRLRFKRVVHFTKNASVQRILKTVLPKRLRTALGLPSLFKSLFLVTEKAPPIDPALRARLMAQYRSEVDAVSELTGRDFAALWGFPR